MGASRPIQLVTIGIPSAVTNTAALALSQDLGHRNHPEAKGHRQTHPGPV
jgi:hypothetical protein